MGTVGGFGSAEGKLIGADMYGRTSRIKRNKKSNREQARWRKLKKLERVSRNSITFDDGDGAALFAMSPHRSLATNARSASNTKFGDLSAHSKKVGLTLVRGQSVRAYPW